MKCPCCFTEPPIQPQQLKPAPPLIQTLLKDIMVKCVRCNRDFRAGNYDTRECSTLPSKVEVKMASVHGPGKTGFHLSRAITPFMGNFRASLPDSSNAFIGGTYSIIPWAIECTYVADLASVGRINTCPFQHATILCQIRSSICSQL